MTFNWYAPKEKEHDGYKAIEEFDESKYAKEARQRWGKTREFAESQKKWPGYSEEQKEAIKSEGDRLITRMVMVKY